jgi:hypothetical protein
MSIPELHSMPAMFYIVIALIVLAIAVAAIYLILKNMANDGALLYCPSYRMA